MSTNSFDKPSASASDQVVEEWLDPHLPTVFASRHEFIVKSQRATSEAVITAAGIKSGFNVIDIGCGSGIPSLQVADLVGPSGHVTATDPSPVFVAAILENASKLGLTNLTAV